jgi:hypothetical protein
MKPRGAITSAISTKNTPADWRLENLLMIDGMK